MLKYRNIKTVFDRRDTTYSLVFGMGVIGVLFVGLLGCLGSNGITGSAPTAPAAPALSAGNAALSAQWNAPSSNGGSVIIDYDVRYRDASNDWQSWDHETATTATTITGLNNDVRYEVQVRASNVFGVSPWSSLASATPLNNLPNAPRNLTATTGNQRLDVSWDAPSETGGADISGYDVDYRAGNSGDWNTKVLNITTATAFTELTNGTSYQLRVRAKNSNGKGAWSSVVSAIPSTLPAKPAVPTITSENQQLVVSWSAPNDGGSAITGYNLRYRTGNNGDWSNWSHSGTGTSATITGLTNSTNYQVQVRAINSNGASAWSDVTAAQPQGALLSVSGITAFTSGEGNVTGARAVSNAISGIPADQTVTIKKVVRQSTNTTLSSHKFFIGSDKKITVGNSSNVTGSFAPPAVDSSADTYRLTLGCSDCSDLEVDVKVERTVAIFSIGIRQGNFGFDACYNYLNAGSPTTLASKVTADGFVASTARFFGSQSRAENVDGTSGDESGYDFPAFHTTGLELSGNAVHRLMQAYKASGGSANSTTLYNSNTVTVAQLAGVNGVGRWDNNNGGDVIDHLLGNKEFWSFTILDRTSSFNCNHAQDNFSHSGGIGSKVAIDGGGSFSANCSYVLNVLCVAK